jgi:hypothetical protein
MLMSVTHLFFLYGPGSHNREGFDKGNVQIGTLRRGGISGGSDPNGPPESQKRLQMSKPPIPGLRKVGGEQTYTHFRQLLF